MNKEKNVDESWKESAASAKDAIVGEESSSKEQNMSGEEVSFLNYITSLIFQAMVFLGEIPNPMNDNKVEKNLLQAKLLIDTISVLRDKTTGNLDAQEENILNTSLYELQMKYVEQSRSGDQNAE
ncbi:MAG: DUF1844 domain-containing protein [Candidatus Omnitrophica bacterium]|nr:DUF1844 domain-containing protein [Candidatus Omnitrophota bacterium]